MEQIVVLVAIYGWLAFIFACIFATDLAYWRERHWQMPLRKGNHYSVLGVLCDLYRIAHPWDGRAAWTLIPDEHGDTSEQLFQCIAETVVLPLPVQQWAGLFEERPQVYGILPWPKPGQRLYLPGHANYQPPVYNEMGLQFWNCYYDFHDLATFINFWL